MQVETYELFISRSFHEIFSSRGWLQVTETTEGEMVDKGDQCPKD